MTFLGVIKGAHLPHVPLASRLGPSAFLCWESFSPSHLLICLSLTHPSDLDFKAHFPLEFSLVPDRVQGPAMAPQGLYPHTPNRASSTQVASLNSAPSVEFSAKALSCPLSAGHYTSSPHPERSRRESLGSFSVLCGAAF